MSVTAWVYFFLAVSVLSLIVALWFTREVIGSDTGTPAMQQIAAAIKESAEAFLKRRYKTAAALLCLLLPAFAPTLAYAQTEHAGGGEASLTLPDLTTVHFVNFFGLNGHALLSIGLLFCVGGLLFGLAIYVQLKSLPVHRTRTSLYQPFAGPQPVASKPSAAPVIVLTPRRAKIIPFPSFSGPPSAGPGRHAPLFVLHRRLVLPWKSLPAQKVPSHPAS